MFGDATSFELRWKDKDRAKPVSTAEQEEFLKWRETAGSQERQEFEDWRAWQEWKKKNPK